MNADEIVRALRECGDCDTCPYYSCWIDEHTGDPADACDEGRLFRDVIALIESLQAQLAASQLAERDKEIERLREAITSVHESLDFADTQRQSCKNYTELAINNGLALGQIAVALKHDFKEPEEGAEK